MELFYAGLFLHSTLCHVGALTGSLSLPPLSQRLIGSCPAFTVIRAGILLPSLPGLICGDKLHYLRTENRANSQDGHRVITGTCCRISARAQRVEESGQVWFAKHAFNFEEYQNGKPHMMFTVNTPSKAKGSNFSGVIRFLSGNKRPLSCHFQPVS